MTTPKKETVFLVSCYDLQAHALRRQARCWTYAGHPVELLFFKRPGLIPFSHQEANLLAQEVRQVRGTVCPGRELFAAGASLSPFGGPGNAPLLRR